MAGAATPPMSARGTMFSPTAANASPVHMMAAYAAIQLSQVNDLHTSITSHVPQPKHAQDQVATVCLRCETRECTHSLSMVKLRGSEVSEGCPVQTAQRATGT